jgi:hypothetical protein
MLGPAESPARVAAYYLFVLGWEAPMQANCLYWFSRRQEWIAPPGKYVKGRTYKPIALWTLAAGAIMAGLYAMFALVGSSIPIPGGTLDLAATATSLTSVYFGPIVSFISITLGAVLRFLVTGRTPGVPAMMPAFAIADAYRWVVGGYIFWRLVRTKKTVSKYLYWGVTIPAQILIHRSSIWLQHTWRFPWEVFITRFLASLPRLPLMLLPIFVGVLAGEAAYRLTRGE